MGDPPKFSPSTSTKCNLKNIDTIIKFLNEKIKDCKKLKEELKDSYVQLVKNIKHTQSTSVKKYSFSPGILSKLYNKVIPNNKNCISIEVNNNNEQQTITDSNQFS
ncbi:MAG: hypothetical protein ACI4PR_04690 [Acutalibacteraceae bacterium]